MPAKRPATMPLAVPTPDKPVAYPNSTKDSASKLHRIHVDQVKDEKYEAKILVKNIYL
jgi:hypothetical protein